jgi:hypothetical protein
VLLFNYMEQQQNQVENFLAPLKKVTPLSKYLALALFVVLPFIGGWIGYVYAPERVVEIEKVVKLEKSAVEEKSNESTVAPEISGNKSQFGDFTLVSYRADASCAYGGASISDCMMELFEFTGKSQVRGYIETEWMNSPFFVVAESDIEKMPSRLTGINLTQNVYTHVSLDGERVSEMFEQANKLPKNTVMLATIELSDFVVGIGVPKGNSGMPYATNVKVISTSTASRSEFPDPSSVSYHEER